MKKTITIPRIEALPHEASQVPQLLDTLGAEFNSIATVNWPEGYPYCPEAAFRLAWCPEGLIIHYRVREQGVLARYANDHDMVWTDSCVEFFIRNAESDTYYNIESNCVGTMVIGLRGEEFGVRPLAPDTMAQVKRWASLGREPFGHRDEPTHWELALIIPSTTFADYPIRLEAGNTLRANVYKCGDDLPVPHFISWSPIHTPEPSFHQPTFFGEVTLG